MAQSVKTLIHVGMFAVYAYTLHYAFYIMHIPELSARFKKFDPHQLKYLTIWDLIIQALFFLMCILNDFFGSNAVNPKKPPLLRKMKDYMHASLGFPLAMFVGITFWALMFVDRELVLPKAIDPYFPWWLNHSMHTLIMISTLLEMILAPKKYPKRSKGLSGLIAVTVLYLVWVHIIYYKSGVWVYPVMEVLSLPLRVVFFAVSLAFVTLLYFIGEALDNFVWGNEYIKKQKSHKAN